MDDDILTIEEVARYLRVSERTVYDWAQKGEIPSGKIGTVWRFKKTEIERWVNERLSSNKTSIAANTVKLRNMLSPERVVFLDHPRKRDAIVALAESIAKAPQVKNRQELVSEILRREELMSTAIGRGIAIPHVRLSSVTDLVIAVGMSRCDIIDFSAFDDQPIRLLIMVAAAYNQHAYYLQTLSFLSSKLKNTELRGALTQAAGIEEIYDLLVKQDDLP
ncbi:MAG: PTS sugar transporter subunit IIA [Spirochaetes bacterium]|nr:PTS sugar transporter subunit IIA [Spirochaetota bacterium]